jgi:hypothetical protein
VTDEERACLETLRRQVPHGATTAVGSARDAARDAGGRRRWLDALGDAWGRAVEAAVGAAVRGADLGTDRRHVRRALVAAGLDPDPEALARTDIAHLDPVGRAMAGRGRVLAAAAGSLWGAAGPAGSAAALPGLVWLCFRGAARVAAVYGLDVRDPAYRRLPAEALLRAVGVADSTGAPHEDAPSPGSRVRRGVRFATRLAIRGARRRRQAALARTVAVRLARRLGLDPSARALTRVAPVAGAFVGAADAVRLVSDVHESALNLSRLYFLERKAAWEERSIASPDVPGPAPAELR